MSLSLRVGQLIYTRVEAAYSPQRKSGFQTVCHSTSLTPSAVQAIEQRVQCFQQQADIVRWQFFRLDSGAFVLTHTCLLTRPDTTIIDATGRSGAFLVHGLVLTPEQFTAIDDNPFAILTAYPFQRDPQSMLEHIAQTAEDGHHTQVKPQPVPAVVDGNVSTTVHNLVGLARQARDVTRKGQSLLLVGSAEAITDTLRTAFALMPRQQRSACSFDTCIDRCTSRPGLYWMVGASTCPYGGNYLHIQLQEPHRAVASRASVQAKGMLAPGSMAEREHESQPAVPGRIDAQPEAVLAQSSTDEGERAPQPEAVLAQSSTDGRERAPQPEAVLAQSSTDGRERAPQHTVTARSTDDVSVRSARVRPHRPSGGRAVTSGRSKPRGVQRRSRPNSAPVSRRNKASMWAWLLRFLFGLLRRR